MLHRDAVDVAGEAQGEVGHIHQAIVQAVGAVNGGGAVVAKHLIHVVETELVVACRNGRVRSEDALLAYGLDVGLSGLAQGFARELFFEQRDGEQRRVALVHMVDVELAAERVQQGDAAESEHGLLTEAVVGVAAVEVIGEVAVPGVVALNIGVEQEDGDDVAGDADDVEAPGADQQLASLQGEREQLVSAGKRCLG